jgi:hypothetical protein
VLRVITPSLAARGYPVVERPPSWSIGDVPQRVVRGFDMEFEGELDADAA